MKAKPRVLVLVGAFLPGFKAGGPIQSVANLVARLGNEFAFQILTTDRDLGDHAPYPDNPRDRWISAYGAQVRYCSPVALKASMLATIIRETPHDLLYLNSFFSKQFSIVPLVARRFGYLQNVPTVLAPRGEFSSGALGLKARRKRAYLNTGKTIGLFQGLHWHASTTHELVDIRAVMSVEERQISVASNLSVSRTENPPTHLPRLSNTPLRVVFLSRISPKKNLDFALQVLAGIDLPIQFTILGPEEDATFSERCRKLAESLPSNIEVRWAGPQPPEAVPQAMADHDLFFLPTHGENFGHVIAEALGAGTPVLLSDTTPWRGLAELGLGYDLSLDQPEQFRDALRKAWYQSPTEAAQIRVRAARYACERQLDSADLEANRTLFYAALDGARTDGRTI